MLGLCAFVVGFTVVGAASTASGPPLEARVRAEAALAERLTTTRTDVPGAAGPERVQFIEGASAVTHRGAATRVRVSSAGIDAEVRSVGLVFRDGRLQYDTPTVGAGHYSGSANPGTAGNVVIAGHVSLRGGTGVFGALPSVPVGSTVEVSSGGQTYRYEVTEVRLVAPEATEVMEPTQDATLTLITCSSDNAHAKRVVVVGKLA
ncbi:MAG: sortase [Dehalococcoidia bacterium]